MTPLIPSILSDDLNVVREHLAALAQLNPVPTRIQIDVIDGEFAPELTIEPHRLFDVELYGFELDFHFMTFEPIDYVSEVKDLPGARTVIAQIERMHSQSEFIEEVQASHLQAGFSLDLYTPFESLEPDLLHLLSVVQIMGNQAGRSGESFQESVLPKIEEAVEYKRDLGLEYEICVDIGMNPQTIPQVLAAGADTIVIGSYLHHSDKQQAWDKLLEVV